VVSLTLRPLSLLRNNCRHPLVSILYGLDALERRKRLSCFTMVSFLACFSILKMEAIYSTETLFKFQWTTRLPKQLVYRFSEIIKIYFDPFAFPFVGDIEDSHGRKYL
jgi:hypothetical protein